MANEATTWPELAIDLFEQLTGHKAEITYEFENMEVWIPSGTGEDVKHAKWKLNGILKIRSRHVDEG